MDMPQFVESARYPVRPENTIRAYVDGVAAFSRIARAIDAAERCVLVTIAWFHLDFVWPDGRGLSAALPDPALLVEASTCFSGTDEQRDFLRERNPQISLRWDDAGDAVVHHQKSWVIDPGAPRARAFVGGMNINPAYLVEPGHADGGMHDLFVEIAGPAVADVHDNFVDRWNHTPDRDPLSGSWGVHGAESLEAIPARDGPPGANASIQVQRTMMRTAERTIRDQYLRAINSARQFIYVENQFLEDLTVVEALHHALSRKVVVTVVVPADFASERGRDAGGMQELREQISRLQEHPNCTISGLSVAQGSPERTPIHIHSKLLIVDDLFVSVGSCNCRRESFTRHSELNVSVVEPGFAKSLRCELLSEHIERDTASMTGVEAMQLFGETARSNGASKRGWRGIAFSLHSIE